MKVLNLASGKVEDRPELDIDKSIEDNLKKGQAFTVNEVEFAGYCITCGNPVLKVDAFYTINRLFGDYRLDVEHRRCL